jgi:hypothetical protein
VSIFTANPETLDFLWPHALPHLKRFSEETLLINTDDLYEKLKTNDRQMWLIEREGKVVLVVVTEIWAGDSGPVCMIKIASGTAGHEALREICDEIEGWARGMGCAGMEISGRKGWLKVLDGFKQTGVILEKDLRKVH